MEKCGDVEFPYGMVYYGTSFYCWAWLIVGNMDVTLGSKCCMV